MIFQNREFTYQELTRFHSANFYSFTGRKHCAQNFKEDFYDLWQNNTVFLDGEFKTLCITKGQDVCFAYCKIGALDVNPSKQASNKIELVFYKCSIDEIQIQKSSSIALRMNECDLSGEIDLFHFMDLSGTRINGVLVNSVNDPGAESWLEQHTQKTDQGYIVYKRFNSYYSVPSYWSIGPGCVLEERVNPDPNTECSYGINVSDISYQLVNNVSGRLRGLTVWKCLIKYEDVDKVCVPFASDGKIRCSRVTLLEELSCL